MKHNPVETIRRKRDGEQLSSAELAEFIGGVVRGEVADYQASAFLMAVFFRGMTAAETGELTRQMLLSGAQLDWPKTGRPVVDKHSSGGVGDKVSLILAPMLACCGLRVPMISGRGLGATGGTLDKLEAIPGFRANLTPDEFRSTVDRVGCVIAGATADLVPADRKLYALRDVTATVPSIPLITGSIMSKKLAEGLDALVLDVKWGSGAFMKQLDGARQLARSLVDVGRDLGLKTIALVTDMNQPLGRTAGHAVEVDESVAALEGDWSDDLREVTLALGVELLVATGRETTPDAARARLEQSISSGTALAKFREMVAAQGGNLDAPRPKAPAVPIVAPRSGYISAIDCELLGRAIAALGGGRQRVEDKLDLSVGLEMRVRLGQRVAQGQPLLNLLAHDRGREAAGTLVEQAFTIGDDPLALPKLIVDRIT
ncbi:MAG TPA: thymidine phosphorylase [Pirellulales bacterium]|nr:thymidine phosphorylase [Pirellulales bacterium]